MIVEEDYDLLKKEMAKQVKVYYYEYEEKLKQLKRLHHKVVIEREVLMTTGFMKQYLKDDTLIQCVYNVNRILEMREQIIDLSRQLYLKALQITSLVDIELLSILYNNQKK